MRVTSALAALFAASAYAAPVEIDSRGYIGDGSHKLGDGIQNMANNAANMLEKGGSSIAGAINAFGQDTDNTMTGLQSAAQLAQLEAKLIGQMAAGEARKMAQDAAANAQKMGQAAANNVKGMVDTVEGDVKNVTDSAGHLAKGANHLGKDIINGLSNCAKGNDPNCN